MPVQHLGDILLDRGRDHHLLVPAGQRRESPAAIDGAQTFQALKAEAERRIVITALERNAWHVTRTAEALGLADHASLLKIMRRHNIRRP